MNPDGGDPVRITNDIRPTGEGDSPPRFVGDSFAPSWSPDGLRIAYAAYEYICMAYDEVGCVRYVGDAEIFVINSDGTGQVQLTSNSASDDSPAWSPDGTKIAFATNRDEPNIFFCARCNYEIYLMNPDGSNQTNLTKDPDSDSFPSWSPDGTKIAFTTGREEPDPGNCSPCNNEIYKMNADGTGQVNISSNPANDLAPAWSPDGRQLAFTSDRDFGVDIFRMNADGTSQTRLTSGDDTKALADWQPLPLPLPADFKNAAEFCRAVRDSLGEQRFRDKYSTTANGSNAFGKCVSENAQKQ
jgi:TolB protein